MCMIMCMRMYTYMHGFLFALRLSLIVWAVTIQKDQHIQVNPCDHIPLINPISNKIKPSNMISAI